MTSSGIAESLGVATLVCIVLLTVSSPIIYTGLKNKGRFSELHSICSNDDEADIGEYVAFSGTIQSRSGTIKSPMRSRPCCLAMWDICTLQRRAIIGAGAVWTKYWIGMKADNIIIETGDREVSIRNLST